MSRHCFLPVRSRFVCTRGPSVVGADESPKVVLSLSLTHCLLFCVSDSQAVTSETSSLRCHHHTESSSLYPRDAPFSLSYCVYTPTNRITSARDTLRPKKQNLLLFTWCSRIDFDCFFFFLLDRKLYDDDNTVIRSLNNAPLCCLSTRHGQEPFIIFKRSSYSASDA